MRFNWYETGQGSQLARDQTREHRHLIPILSPDLISESWTLPFLHFKLLWMTLWEYLVALVRTTMSKAWRLQEVKGRILTSGRLWKHCLFAVFKLNLQFLIPWEVNLSQELPRWNKESLILSRGLKLTKRHCSPKKAWRVSVYSSCILLISIKKKTPSVWPYITL